MVTYFCHLSFSNPEVTGLGKHVLVSVYLAPCLFIKQGNNAEGADLSSYMQQTMLELNTPADFAFSAIVRALACELPVKFSKVAVQHLPSPHLLIVSMPDAACLRAGPSMCYGTSFTA